MNDNLTIIMILIIAGLSLAAVIAYLGYEKGFNEGVDSREVLLKSAERKIEERKRINDNNYDIYTKSLEEARAKYEGLENILASNGTSINNMKIANDHLLLDNEELQKEIEELKKEKCSHDISQEANDLLDTLTKEGFFDPAFINAATKTTKKPKKVTKKNVKSTKRKK